MVQRIRVLSFVALLFVFASSASASSITYVWEGTDGFTGSFTFDSSSLFISGGSGSLDDSALTAFTFSGDGVTFNLADALGAGGDIFFNTAVSPAIVTDGGGNLAKDPAGDTVGIYGSDVEIDLASGGYEDSTGSWVVPSAAPEPSPLLLLGIGLLSVAFARRRVRLPLNHRVEL